MSPSDPVESARTAQTRLAWRPATHILGLMIMLAPAVGAQNGDDVLSFQQVVEYHLGSYPAMEVEDLYKLVFQAAMGSEHAVSDHRAAREWLERELSNLAAAAPEPLSEPLSPDGALVRVNLRTYDEQGGEVDRLLDAFVTTAKRFEGSEDRLRSYWSDIEAMALAAELPFGVVQLRELFSEMESRGFPPVHHSTQYREHYKPAYRVVLVELLESANPETPGQ